MTALPADFPRPTKHPFDPDPENENATCATCGYPEPFGALHNLPAPEPVPDTEGFQAGDVLRNPHTGSIWAVRRHRSRPDRLVFLEMHPTYAQDHAPADAQLLVRAGRVQS